MKRFKTDLAIFHCSDSDIPAHDNIDTIRGWHVNERKFSDVGYHFFIRKDGRIEIGRALDEQGAHAYGYNAASIGICLSGRDYFTKEQFTTAKHLCMFLNYVYPNIGFIGHCDVSEKTCPNFDYKELILKGLKI